MGRNPGTNLKMKNEDQKLMNYECEGRQETQGINLWIQHVITKQKTRIKRRVLRNKNEERVLISGDLIDGILNS